MSSAIPTVMFFLLVLWSPSEKDGRLLHLSGSSFSLEVLEPEGWQLATRAAPQIANFIFHPEGTDWRRAEAVIYVRIVPREETEKREEFVESSRERFREQCPFFGSEPEAKSSQQVAEFLVEEFRCPSIRQEIMAVREVPRFFLIFSLSGQTETPLEKYIGVFRRILTSLRWHVKSGDNADHG